MAQDFSSAFGLGGDAHYIGTLDADGVALAAIQGLYQINQQQAAEIQSLKDQLARMGTAGASRSGGSSPLLWGGMALLAVAQVGMLTLLRRKGGQG
jgi:trimeric autotransporter adhesin